MKKKTFSRKASLATGQILIHLGMIALAIFAYYLLNSYVSGIASDKEFEKMYLVRDLALLNNAIYSAPGNTEYNYFFENLDLAKFNFEFKDKEKRNVFVGYEGRKSVYPYGSEKADTSDFSVQGSNTLKITKNGQKVTITGK